MNEFALAVDVGGTFTDVILTCIDSGETWTCKTPTTPADPSIGFVSGIDEVLTTARVDACDVVRVLHGTTIATNAILESKGAATGLVTTHGFRYVLEIGRQDASRWINLNLWEKPKRPVSPEHIREIRGRISPDGTELVPLDEATCRAAGEYFRENDINSIAICFLHAYANPEHEQRAQEIMAGEHPAAMFSRSSDVLPVFREYERTMATVLNSYVMPTVSTYVARLRDGLHDRAIRSPLYIMKSNGGVVGADTVVTQPAFTALSGPAAGVIGAREVANAAGTNKIISIDVGGTSADVALIREHGADITTTGHIGAWPFAAPMIDIHTVGAGGGSLASITRSGNLVVGPASAGADPGPACYGRGGELPSVTDANVVLGRLPVGLVGGELTLDVDAAFRAIEKHVARPLGIDVVAAAAGVVEIIDNNMVGAIRVLTVERGIDPRAFTLFAFGGAGPLHAASVARLLGIGTVLIGRAPGVLSAQGLLVSDVRNDFARAWSGRNPKPEELHDVLKRLDLQAHEWLESEGVSEHARAITWQADLRYEKQSFELTLEIDRAAFERADLAPVYERFHAEHSRLYTYSLPDSPVELVTLRVGAIGTLADVGRPKIATARSVQAPSSTTAVSRQQVHFSEAGGYVDCPVYDRSGLISGEVLAGPALVTQMDTTSVVLPGQTLRVDQLGNMILIESGLRSGGDR